MVLITFLEEGLSMPFKEEETEAQGEPKILSFPHLARVTPVLGLLFGFSLHTRPSLSLDCHFVSYALYCLAI